MNLPKKSSGELLSFAKLMVFGVVRTKIIDRITAIRSNFEACNDDVILTSPMKTGTTWLKALCHCIMRSPYPGGDGADQKEDDPLEKNNPHTFIQSLETQLYADELQPDLSGMPSPRLFQTHLRYNFLSDSIKNSECKIVYIARNPKDTLVSLWHFYNEIKGPSLPPFPIDKAVESFYNCVHPYGPFHDHVLEYWKESIKRPHKVLFLRYEDLKRYPKGQLERLAGFLGRPLNNQSEIDGVIWRCSLERLKNLEVNQEDGERVSKRVPNSAYFRLGAVGDWMNYLTPEMGKHLDRLARMKFDGTGLDLEA